MWFRLLGVRILFYGVHGYHGGTELESLESLDRHVFKDGYGGFNNIQAR